MVLVGRQPILDRNGQTFAYELLFRSSAENRFDASDGSTATKAVISNACMAIGCNRVLSGKPGFINFTRQLLLDGQAEVLPKERVVVEVLEDVEPDADVQEVCRRLKERGYRIALDDVTATNADSPLAAFATYIKLDWLALAPADRSPVCNRFLRRGIRLLAEKVETKADFEAARACGCELFQGYYFAKPEILSTTNIPSAKTACLRLIREIQAPELDFDRLESLVKPDIGLTRKLLLFVNAAAFSHQNEIESLSQAFFYLGENNIRKWVMLAALPELGGGGPAELVTLSLVRARLCELVAENSESAGRPGSCFLAGLMSLLDTMVGRPLGELVDDLGLDAQIRDAILGVSGEDDPLRAVLNLAIARERSDLDEATRLGARFGLSPERLAELHIDAIAWADELPR
ncbi:MAG TPA: EAL domain-containing protein [Bryobacteraceae bacterium]|nr:EAL domain-containing protein [Bryobacteraceae bacterium]